MDSVPRQRAVAPSRRGEALALWLGLLVGFSPVLLDLARHVAASPWARYALIFPFLFARCALREREPLAKHRDGYLWIGLGIGLELLGILAGVTRIGRAGLILAAVGLCRRFGLASGPSLILLALSVPLPSAALEWTSPVGESAWLGLAAAGLNALGLGIEVAHTRALYGTQTLVLEAFDAGAPLVPLLAGLAWYDSLMRGVPAQTATVRSAVAALLAFPAQIAAIALALLMLRLEGAGAARLALTHLPWLAVTAAGLVTSERRCRPPGAER